MGKAGGVGKRGGRGGLKSQGLLEARGLLAQGQLAPMPGLVGEKQPHARGRRRDGPAQVTRVQPKGARLRGRVGVRGKEQVGEGIGLDGAGGLLSGGGLHEAGGAQGGGQEEGAKSHGRQGCACLHMRTWRQED